jgi:hypothetical protein
MFVYLWDLVGKDLDGLMGPSLLTSPCITQDKIGIGRKLSDSQREVHMFNQAKY